MPPPSFSRKITPLFSGKQGTGRVCPSPDFQHDSRLRSGRIPLNRTLRNDKMSYCKGASRACLCHIAQDGFCPCFRPTSVHVHIAGITAAKEHQRLSLLDSLIAERECAVRGGESPARQCQLFRRTPADAEGLVQNIDRLLALGCIFRLLGPDLLERLPVLAEPIQIFTERKRPASRPAFIRELGPSI